MTQVANFIAIGDRKFRISFAIGGVFTGPPPDTRTLHFALKQPNEGPVILLSNSSVLLFRLSSDNNTEVNLSVLINGNNQATYRIPSGLHYTRSVNEIINPNTLILNDNNIEFRIGPANESVTSVSGSLEISDVVIFYKLDAWFFVPPG